MRKKILITIGFFVFVVAMFVFPLWVEKLIRGGIFGYDFPNSIFNNEQWFAFWGSYLGSIITVIVLFVTIRYNKRETENTIKDYELETQCNRLLKNLEEIHNYINLCEPSGEEIENPSIIYHFKILCKKYYELMNECETSCDGVCKEYICLIKKILYEHLMEIENVPKRLDNIKIEDAAEIYKDATKKMFSIKHKYIQQEQVLYDRTVSGVEKEKIKIKKSIFKI